MRRAEAVAADKGRPLARIADDFTRIARAIRLAIVAAMRLRGYLRSLASLRQLSPADLAAARTRARAAAEQEAAARQAAADRALARREASEAGSAEASERLTDDEETETPDRAERDPLVAALAKRLDVDPLVVDLDDLPLRETVMRICADLGVTPDWARWEAGAWEPEDAAEADEDPVPARSEGSRGSAPANSRPRETRAPDRPRSHRPRPPPRLTG